MGTSFLECGCFITDSMYGEHEILSINLCLKHCLNTAIAAKAQELARLIIATEVEIATPEEEC